MDRIAADKTDKAGKSMDKTAACLLGKDELNLIEFPFGPISKSDAKTFEIEHVTRDRKTKKPTTRTLVIIGSDAFGLPTPFDERVMLGLKALTFENSFQSRKVFFSRYQLCRVIGLMPDGRSYKRIEESLDRITGTTLKFKNSWWDKQEQDWCSHTFHLIDNVELCSADRYHKRQSLERRRTQPLCSFVWNEVIWKSFSDGYMRTLDMDMIRRIGQGRRREVPLRLYRWLAKQFYKRNVITMDICKLGKGTLGLSGDYPSEFRRIIERAAKILISCNALGGVAFRRGANHPGLDVVFEKYERPRRNVLKKNQTSLPSSEERQMIDWAKSQKPQVLKRAELEALRSGFGQEFVQDYVGKLQSEPFRLSDPVRLRYVWTFLKSKSKAA